jgi:Rrf2 family protein
MFTKTTISAIRTLLFLASRDANEPLSLGRMAASLGESPTYLAKTTRLLVKAGILRAQPGVAGGAMLRRAPEQITVLAIVEACRGAILGDFCQETDDLTGVCGLHRVAAEVHEANVRILSRWTLADLLQHPTPLTQHASGPHCYLDRRSARTAGRPADGDASPASGTTAPPGKTNRARR